jgi:predicted ATPase/DNA-binding SARP family transcriptional activator
MPPVLHIQLLGEFRIWTDTGPVEGINSPRAQAFLAYLLLHRNAPQSRQALAFLLYPDSTEKQARTNLRHLIHLLRQALPAADEFVLADGQFLQWRVETPFMLDVLDFETAQAGSMAQLRAAVELYGGELLPGCYDDWVLAERERLRQRFVEILEQLIGLLTEQRDYASAIHYAEQLLRQDSLREETYRLLMRLHAWRGDPAGVVRVFQMCAAVLQRELGVEVSPETRLAYENLRALKVAALTPAEVAPPRRTHNLPLQLTRFLGREQEVSKLQQLLRAGPDSPAVRLLTLTGVGGSGKTRLALRVAACLSRDGAPGGYPDGVWLVELAPLSEASQVALAVAKALNVQEQQGGTLLGALTDQLQAKALLLLLDNCEHLLNACAQLAETLLQHCPALTILATSRERLNIVGEHCWPVPTLSLPRPADEQQVADLRRSEAVQLFVERAAATLPSFHLNTVNAGAIARICRQLDGIPLAIELAAARVKVIAPEQMAERLDDRFRLLTGGSRTALPRQQTLRGLVDWSYDLLSEPERILFQRLSVFAGGWTLEAAEAVCGDKEKDESIQSPFLHPSSFTPAHDAGAWVIHPSEVLDALAHLVDKSLVTPESSEQSPRYRYLETIRQYAYEKLQAAGDGEPMQQCHLAFFCDLVVASESAVLGPDQFAALDRLDAEHDNIRAASDWAARGGSAADGLRMSGALFPYWLIRSRWTEGSECLEMLLARPEAQARTVERARALGVYATLQGLLGNWELSVHQFTEGVALARELGASGKHSLCEMLAFWSYLSFDNQAIDTTDNLAQEGLQIARELKDDYLAAIALNTLGMIAFRRGDLGLARRVLTEGVALGRAAGNTWGASIPLGNLSSVLIEQGDYARAQPTISEAMDIFRRIGDKYDLGIVLGYLGEMAWRQGDLTSARAWRSESLAVKREHGIKFQIAWELCYLAVIALSQYDTVAAQAWLRESLTLCSELTDDSLAVNNIAAQAAAEARAGTQPDWARAVRLSAAAEALRSLHNDEWVAGLEKMLAETMAAGRAALDEAAFKALFDAGSAMPLEQAIDYALAPG